MTHQYIVSDIFEISGRGPAALFDGNPPIFLPIGTIIGVQIRTPSGGSICTTAQIEAVRKVPPGEVLGMILPKLSQSEIPIGSVVLIDGN